MPDPFPPKEREVTIRDVFPEFTEEQLIETEAKLRDYVAFSVRMYDRIRADLVAYAEFKKKLEVWRKLRQD